MAETDAVSFTIRIPKELHQAAKERAKADDVTISQAIRWYLRAWVQGEVATLPPKREKAS
jgi:predicted HicB family RNase H-like nuclease